MNKRIIHACLSMDQEQEVEEVFEVGDVVVITDLFVGGGHSTSFLRINRITPKGMLIGNLLKYDEESVVNCPLEVTERLKPQLDEPCSTEERLHKRKYGTYGWCGEEVIVERYDPSVEYKSVIYYR